MTPVDVTITDVLLRDGLQDHPSTVSTPLKLSLATALLETGLHELEVGLFVPSSLIPQMADSADVLAGLPARDARFITLAPNATGAERALKAGSRDVRLFLSASEGHSRANTNRSVRAGIDAVTAVARDLLSKDVHVSVGIAVAFVCPFDGVVDAESVVAVVTELHAAGVEDVILADTIGQATPEQIATTAQAVRIRFPAMRLGFHLHSSTSGSMAVLSNVDAALESGIRRFDAAAGGLGGCPFAPGAGGNLATETVVAHLDRLGYRTGISVDGVRALADSVPALLQDSR